MRRRAADALCVFLIHLARLRTEAGPFLLAALGFPAVMYMFASAVGDQAGSGTSDPQHRLRFLAGSIVFSLSMTAVSWLGYLLLENRFTGRLRLFATLPLAPSSYVLGISTAAQHTLADRAWGQSSPPAGAHSGRPVDLAPLRRPAIRLGGPAAAPSTRSSTQLSIWWTTRSRWQKRPRPLMRELSPRCCISQIALSSSIVMSHRR